MEAGPDASGEAARSTGPASGRARVVARSALAGSLGVVAILGLIASMVALWARASVFDEAHVAGAVDDALAQPAVTDALARYVTDLVLDADDLTATVSAILPDQLDRLGPAVVGGVRSLVHEELADVLSRDSTRELVVGLAEQAHRTLMRLLEGEGVLAGVTVDDGEVSINLLPLVALGLRGLQSHGFLDGVTVPELVADGDPAAQIVELEAALGRELRDGFGQLVLYRTDSLAAAGTTLSATQRATALLKRATALLVLVTIIAFPAAVLLARRRRRAVVVLALGAAGGLLATRAVLNAVLHSAPDIATDPGARAAIVAVVDSLTGGLLAGIGLLALLSLLLALAVYLDGPGPTARAIRSRLACPGSATESRVDERRAVVAATALLAAALCITIVDLSRGVIAVVSVLVLAAAWSWWPLHRRRQAAG